jgi:hypothetical protein
MFDHCAIINDHRQRIEKEYHWKYQISNKACRILLDVPNLHPSYRGIRYIERR